MTPGDEMLDAEQVIAEALSGLIDNFSGKGITTADDYADARAVLAALSSNGFHVFSERELWAHVRERVEVTGHAGNRWRFVAAALDAAERGTDDAR